MKKRSRLPEGDDGKVIAKMDVDGMPWYLQKLHNDEEGSSGPAYQMNKEEGRAYMWGALAASLLVVGIFALFFAAVILLLLWLFNK